MKSLMTSFEEQLYNLSDVLRYNFREFIKGNMGEGIKRIGSYDKNGYWYYGSYRRAVIGDAIVGGILGAAAPIMRYGPVFDPTMYQLMSIYGVLGAITGAIVGHYLCNDIAPFLRKNIIRKN